MDALRVTWGMPLVVYYDVEDENVAPREHIIRALGGPACSAALLAIAWLVRSITPPGSVRREVTDAAVEMNLFLSTASLLPIPMLDGGPILKWTLVGRGRTRREAEEVVKRANKLVGVGLGVATGIAVKKKGWFIGGVLGMLTALVLAVGLGLVEE
jgi:Zn-dependent protease